MYLPNEEEKGKEQVRLTHEEGLLGPLPQVAQASYGWLRLSG